MSQQPPEAPGRSPLRLEDAPAPPRAGAVPTRAEGPPGLLGALVLGLGLLGILLWGSMLLAPYKLGTGLVDARDHVRRAQRALTNTQLKKARYETLAAAAAVDRAQEGLAAGGPALDLARAVPFVDRAMGEVDHIIEAVDHTTKAAIGTLNVAQDALDGPRSVIIDDPANPDEKKFSIERLEEISAIVSDVRSEVLAARAALNQIDLDNLPEQAHDAIIDARSEAKDATKTIREAEAGLKILPAVLGGDGPRTYMIGFQNPAEQRGTGGAILRFNFLQITDGSVEFVLKTATSRVYNVDENREPISIDLPADAWYVANILDAQRFGNANWSPDFPSAAELTLRYGQATPADIEFPDLAGIFVLDPLAAQDLMPGVGPYTTRQGNRISKRKIVDFLIYRLYGKEPVVPAKRGIILNQVVNGFYNGLFDPLHPTELLKGFGEALRTKHMQLWMTDPREQRFVERMDWDGAITPPDELRKDDYVMVVEQNVGGSKLDYFDTNTNTFDIALEGDDALVTAEMRVRNGVFLPQPRYSMGDSQTIGGACASGRRCPLHRPMLNLYVRDDAEFVSAEVVGVRIDAPPTVATWTGDGPPEHFEHGKKVWSGTLEIEPEEEAALTFDYRVPGVVQSRRGRKVYRLHVQHQPKVRPETYRVTVRLPEGARGVRVEGFERDGDMLVWEKDITEDTILEVSWRE